jgi:peptidoglycan/LPS O-acetylase OafA/YrhL
VLGGLRGLAITLVLLSHFAPLPKPTSILEKIYARGPQAGWVGVDLFFVLSGFLITRILLRTKSSSRYFQSFYARRTLRIFPLYYGVLVLFFVILPRVSASWATEVNTDYAPSWPFWTYSGNVARVFHTALIFHGNAVSRSLAHFWSLMVEEQFYLCWPMVVFLVPTKSLVRVCLGTFALAMAVRLGLLVYIERADLPRNVVYSFTLGRIDTLAAGALVAILVEEHGLAPWLRRGARKLGIAAAVVLAVVFLMDGGLLNDGVWMQRIGFPATGALSAVLLVELLFSPPRSALRRGFSSTGMRAMGRYSYGIYVYHLLVLHHVLMAHDVEGRVHAAIANRIVASLAFTAIGAGLSIAVAVVSYHAYEQPFLRMKRFFEAGGRTRAPKNAPA